MSDERLSQLLVLADQTLAMPKAQHPEIQRLTREVIAEIQKELNGESEQFPAALIRSLTDSYDWDLQLFRALMNYLEQRQ